MLDSPVAFSRFSMIVNSLLMIVTLPISSLVVCKVGQSAELTGVSWEDARISNPGRPSYLDISSFVDNVVAFTTSCSRGRLVAPGPSQN